MGLPEEAGASPLAGSTSCSFGAACHREDCTFVFTASQDQRATTSPQTGAAFGFWHPNLVTFHVWLWYPIPSGLHAAMNPLLHPFNAG